MSKQQDMYVCVWVYMRFVLRTQAWQCINDKILEGTKHTYTLLLSLERNKNSYRTLYDCVVCVHRAEFLTFLSFPLSFSLPLSPFVAVYMATTKDEEKKKYYILSIIWLVDFFFASSFSPHFIVTCLLFFLILSSRFVDKRPRKGRGHPIEEKKQVISSCKRGFFFFVRHQRVTHNTLFFHYYCLSLSFSLPVLVCKSSSSYTRTYIHSQKQHYIRCIVNNTVLKYVFIVWQGKK